MSHSSPPGSRRNRRVQVQAFIDTLTGTGFPCSCRIYMHEASPRYSAYQCAKYR